MKYETQLTQLINKEKMWVNKKKLEIEKDFEDRIECVYWDRLKEDILKSLKKHNEYEANCFTKDQAFRMQNSLAGELQDYVGVKDRGNCHIFYRE